jgi:hypothetical protein
MFILKKKKIFSRISTPVSIKLGVNHAWVKGILNCSKKLPGPVQRGNFLNKKMQTFVKFIEKSFSLRTTEPE